MLGGEALPRGGVVRLLPQEGGVALRPEGRVLNWPPALAAALAGSPPRARAPCWRRCWCNWPAPPAGRPG
ncbi:histidine phosphotransferase family protein [Pseudoroseomonas wenyumeiae]